MRPTYHVQGPLPAVLAVLAALAVSSSALPRPAPHGSGWVPSGAWSAPSYVNPWPAQPAQGWTDYSVSSVSVDPWATQKAKYKANPAAWWATSTTRHPQAPTATSTAWFQRHHQPAQQPLQQLQHLQQHVLQQQHPQQQLLQQPVQYQPAYQPPLHLYQQQAVAAPQQAFQYEYQNYQLEPELVYEVAAVPQVVKKKPSYASLYPWPEKPAYRSVPLHVPSAAPSYTPQHHSGGYAGWTRIPVLDEEGGNQWVAWVPEELGDFVIVRKDKLKPKKKKVEEEEEEEPEPPKPKPKKKVKTIVEEDAPEEEPPKPKKKVKTIVEEEAPEEEPPKPKKKIKTIVEDEVPPKKTTKTTVTTEEQGEPGTSVKETSTSSDTRVTKTEVIEQASTMPESVSVPAPTK